MVPRHAIRFLKMMMKYTGIIFGVILFAELCSSELPSNKCWPFNKNVATSRASPINVNTLAATPITVAPLVQKRVCNERGLLVNTGKGVEVRTTLTSKGCIKGGVFYNETYIYHSTRFFWSNNNTNIVEHAINGIGTTLAVQNYYYNKKYGNFDNSFNHYDGLAIISVLVCVGSTPNPAFNNFQRQLELVARPGSQLNIDIGSSFIWNDYLSIGNYFSYPGSYTAVDNSRIHNCATVIVQPLSTTSPFISRQQFACSFGQLKNSEKKPLTYALPRYPAAGRPISRAVGFQKINLPLNGVIL